MLALGPINPYIAAEINSSNATTLSTVSAFARVSFRSTTLIMLQSSALFTPPSGLRDLRVQKDEKR